jgi:hypothetical protein
LEKHAEKEGYQEFAEINLIQDKINKKIFENLEYRVDSIVLESNKRIRFFGAGYQRMVKRL